MLGVGTSIWNRALAGKGDGSGGNAPSGSYLFTESFTDAENDTGFDYTRATPQHVETDTGALYPVPAGAIPIQKARPARNLAASSDTPSTQNITVVVGRIYAVRIGSESASGATAVCSGAFTGTLTGDGADSYALNGVATATTLTITITGSIRKLQVQDITHRSAISTAPDEYVDSATDHGTGVNGFRYFTTALANTVDGSGVVTEATGAALSNISLANVPGATNLDTRSTPKTADYTTKVGLTITDNVDAGPFGNGSAALITGTGIAGSYANKNTGSVSYAAGTSYCFWQIVKPGTSGWHRMVLPYGPFGNSADREAWFSLSGSGSVGTTLAKIDSAEIRLLGGGYYLCWITSVAVADNLYSPGYITVADADASTSSTGTVYLAHNQVEVGTLPTAPIVTSGSTASTDSAVLDFSGVDGFVTPNETRIVCTGLGPNLVTEGEFSSFADGYDITNEANYALYGSPTSTDIQSQKLEIVAAATAQGVRRICDEIAVGDTVLLVIDYEDGCGIYAFGGSVINEITGSGTKVQYGIATSTNLFLRGPSNLAGTCYYDNIRIYKIDPTDTTERIIDINNWDGTDLSDILPHANVKSVTVYAPGERP